ncbi:MAG: hypothetical protein E6I75_30310 [Chloroflexi bacterium]|nr:MAG: hypothetical protein E6I75_30310 [Chloroflexota bacterium]
MPESISSKSRPLLPRLLPLRKSFSPAEVRQRLLAPADHPRTAAVHAAAALTSVWSSRLPDRLAFDMGRTATRLPSVVLWFRQGLPAQEIGRRLSTFGGAWDAEHALDVAATLIADTLNHGEWAELAA